MWQFVPCPLLAAHIGLHMTAVLANTTLAAPFSHHEVCNPPPPNRQVLHSHLFTHLFTPKAPMLGLAAQLAFQQHCTYTAQEYLPVVPR